MSCFLEIKRKVAIFAPAVGFCLARSKPAAMPPHIRAQCQPLTKAPINIVKNNVDVTILTDNS